MEKSIDQNMYAMKALSNASRATDKCVAFDFNECSLNELQNDYPRLFQLEDEQHVYVTIINCTFHYIIHRKGISASKTGLPIEIVYIIYRYIRRKPADYARYSDKLTKLMSTVRN
jgi:hypothetical protein